MPDIRFHHRSRAFTLAELAQVTGAEIRGNAELLLEDVAPLSQATATDFSFFENRKYLDQFKVTQAGACVVSPEQAKHAPASLGLLLHPQPYAAYAMIAAAFYPSSMKPEALEGAGIHPAAKVDASASVSQLAYVGPEAEVGAGCVIAPYAVIGRGVTLGEHTTVGAGAVITHALVGAHTIIHPGAKIGQDGFGFAKGPKGLIKVPQLGRVIIGQHVEVGANTAIDRGTSGDTVIGDGTKIDNLVQIGHNVQTGRFCIIVSQTGISGSTILGDGVVLGGQSGIAGHLHLGSGAQVAARGGVIADVAAGQTVGGTPSVPIRQWHRQSVALAKLATGQMAGKGDKGE